MRQTRQPRTIVVVDDGSTDATIVRARAFARFHGVNIRVVRRFTSIGKTPTIKELMAVLKGASAPSQNHPVIL